MMIHILQLLHQAPFLWWSSTGSSRISLKLNDSEPENDHVRNPKNVLFKPCPSILERLQVLLYNKIRGVSADIGVFHQLWNSWNTLKLNTKEENPFKDASSEPAFHFSSDQNPRCLFHTGGYTYALLARNCERRRCYCLGHVIHQDFMVVAVPCLERTWYTKTHFILYLPSWKLTYISPFKGYFWRWFFIFTRWDMLVPWRVYGWCICPGYWLLRALGS